MSIEIANESGVEVDSDAILAVARHALDEMGVNPLAELSILLVDADYMAELNHRWMDADGPTDVLAFPMDEGSVDHGPGEASGLAPQPRGASGGDRGGRPGGLRGVRGRHRGRGAGTAVGAYRRTLPVLRRAPGSDQTADPGHRAGTAPRHIAGNVRGPPATAGGPRNANGPEARQQPGSRKLAIRVCQPAADEAWPAAV